MEPTVNMTITSTTMDTGEMDDPHMAMTLFFSSKTPLLSNSWTPKTSTEYAGTCIFLITLAAVVRIMLASKPILERSFWNAELELRAELISEDGTDYQKGIAAQAPTKRVYASI
ncbi:hypothetical protein F5Y11DRAFT_338733 [Daldinia sp. FL1419]|nr:hypothetical protein F5Y11DRAFT_338733 [Daldinia sp. FL1419]